MKRKYWKQLWRDLYYDRYLYLFLLPTAILVLVFCYFPFYGITLAFKSYSGLTSIMNSPWVGLKYFKMVFQDPLIPRAFMNTVILGILSILFCFPAPIFLALCFNELQDGKYKKIAQTISYLPYFISTVIVVGMMKEFLSIDGVLNSLIRTLGARTINFMSSSSAFRSIYIVSEIWQGVGWGSILYLAAIVAVSNEIYEAAIIDGASRLQRIRFITIPSILPTISIQLILAIGNLLGASFEKIVLMYSPANYATADVLATYIYRNGLQNANYSYGIAVGVLNSLISFALVFAANRMMNKLSGYSFW